MTHDQLKKATEISYNIEKNASELRTLERLMNHSCSLSVTVEGTGFGDLRVKNYINLSLSKEYVKELLSNEMESLRKKIDSLEDELAAL